MDWDLAIKLNSKALKGILKSCSPCWGLTAAMRLCGFRAPSTVPCWLCCGPPIRCPAAYCDRGPECCGETGSLPADARRTQDREGWWKQASLLPAL